MIVNLTPWRALGSGQTQPADREGRGGYRQLRRRLGDRGEHASGGAGHAAHDTGHRLADARVARRRGRSLGRLRRPPAASAAGTAPTATATGWRRSDATAATTATAARCGLATGDSATGDSAPT